MKTNELKINGIDAYTDFGLFMTNAGLSALLAPRTPKEPISSATRLESGKRVILPQATDGVAPKYESREFSMECNMIAPTSQLFSQRLVALENVLSAGWLAITTSHRQSTVFHCRYAGISSFTLYQGRAAKFTIKFEEPNPSNRS